MTNAGKFSDPNTSVNLDVTEEVSPSVQTKGLPSKPITITITNVGQGISEEEQEYIFDRFRRVKGDTDGSTKGIGLGLALVKSLVEHIHGTIEVSSYPSDHPSTFVTSFKLSLIRFPSELK